MNEISVRASGDPARPSPYTDRRALSEAWYRALFDTRHDGSRGTAGAHSAAAPSEAARPSSRVSDAGSAQAAAERAAPTRAARLRFVRAAFTTDGRAPGGKPRAAVALRAAVQRALWRRTFCRATLPAGHVVELLVQQRGDLLRLVAIYDGRDAGRVTAGLLRARTALLQRGLRVELDAHQKGSS